MRSPSSWSTATSPTSALRREERVRRSDGVAELRSRYSRWVHNALRPRHRELPSRMLVLSARRASRSSGAISSGSTSASSAALTQGLVDVAGGGLLDDDPLLDPQADATRPRTTATTKRF